MHRSRLLALLCRIAFLVGPAAAIMPHAGCDRGDDAPATAGASGSAAAPAGGGGGPAGAFDKLTPEQFVKEFDKRRGELATTGRAHGVELAGVVEEVSTNVAGDAFVALRAGPQTPATDAAPAVKPVVQCYTNDPEPWAKVARGQHVTLRGSVGYFPGLPNIEKCELVTAGPATAVTVAAADLATEYAAGRDAPAAKYADRDLIVTGKVAERKDDMAGAITLFLDGSGPTRVRCRFGMVASINRDEVGKVRLGQDVKVFAAFGKPTDVNDPAVPLKDCQLITK